MNGQGRVALALLVGACSHRPATTVRTVTDSAGVEIVTIPAPDSTLPVWHVALDSPLAIVGGSRDSTGELSHITSAVISSNGRLLVGTDAGFHVHVFDTLGRPITAFGRTGNGPGEFPNRTSASLFVRGDTLITIWGHGSQFVTTTWNGHWAMTGEHRGRLAIRFDILTGQIGFDRDGGLLAVTEMTGNKRRGPYRTGLTISRLAPDGAVATTFLTLPGQARYRLGGQGGLIDTYVVFGKTTVAAVSGGRLETGTNDGFEIDQWSGAGTLTRRLRVAIGARPVSRADRHAFIDGSGPGDTPDARDANARFRSQLKFADNLPFYDALYGTAQGGIWIAVAEPRGDDPQTYLVVDPSGHLVASLTLAATFTPRFIDDDRVLLRGHDSAGVQFLGLYRLRPDRSLRRP